MKLQFTKQNLLNSLGLFLTWSSVILLFGSFSNWLKGDFATLYAPNEPLQPEYWYGIQWKLIIMAMFSFFYGNFLLKKYVSNQTLNRTA